MCVSGEDQKSPRSRGHSLEFKVLGALIGCQALEPSRGNTKIPALVWGGGNV